VTALPEKMAVYTTLTGLLNAKNYNCGGEVIHLQCNILFALNILEITKLKHCKNNEQIHVTGLKFNKDFFEYRKYFFRQNGDRN
jgi:hypothetical protein